MGWKRFVCRYTPRTNADILAEVQARLAAAPFDASGISLSFEDGSRHLVGTVLDEAAKRDAKALVHSVEGVVHVENELKAADPLESDRIET